MLSRGRLVWLGICAASLAGLFYLNRPSLREELHEEPAIGLCGAMYGMARSHADSLRVGSTLPDLPGDLTCGSLLRLYPDEVRDRAKNVQVRTVASRPSIAAEREAAIRGFTVAEIRKVGKRCSESTAELVRLMRERQSLTSTIGLDTVPRIDFIRAVVRATAQHDSTRSCARLIRIVGDSVVRVTGNSTGMSR